MKHFLLSILSLSMVACAGSNSGPGASQKSGGLAAEYCDPADVQAGCEYPAPENYNPPAITKMVQDSAGVWRLQQKGVCHHTDYVPVIFAHGEYGCIYLPLIAPHATGYYALYGKPYFIEFPVYEGPNCSTVVAGANNQTLRLCL